ncbi:hypothetical protein BGZ73_006020 [Actinomortierella ambigua]|nr:hypothetical protein BGZ73_006020 [Actinomortierella ambigua]
MPLLSFSCPRYRASLIAALLLVELAVILWYRSTVAGDHDDGSWKAVEFLNWHTSWQSPETGDFPSEHLGRRGEDDARMVVAGEQTPADRNSGNKDKKSRWQIWKTDNGAKQEPHAKDRSQSLYRQRVNGGEEEEEEGSYGNQDIDETSPPLASKNRPLTDTKDAATSESNSNTQRESVKTKVGRQSIKGIKDKLKIKSSRRARSKQQHEEAARKAKQREARKQGQLIPVVDESGVEIEDHFISPRDLDGDGTPDTYVLLRPTGNSKYMMDVGLFDEDSAVVAAAAPIQATSTLPPMAPSSPPPTPETAPKPPAVVVVPGNQATASAESSATIDTTPSEQALGSTPPLEG